MSDFKIKTPGEKIKDIREQLNFKQEDITGGEITRNLVSILENNKANLTENVAKLLSQSINNLCKEKGIDFSITEEYLLESVVSQAKKIANEYIEYINALPSEEITKIQPKLTEIDLFLRTYNTEEKRSLLYRTIGNKFIDIKNYYKAINYYLKAYESSLDTKSTINILLRLGTCFTYLSNYNEAINYYNLLLDISNDVQPIYVAKFNIALCHKELGQFEESLKYLYDLKDSFKTIKSDYIQEFEVDNRIGICLYKLKAFNKSIAIFKALLQDCTSDKQELMILTNLADIYRETNDYVTLRKVCTKISDKIKNTADFMDKLQGYLYMSLSENLMAIGEKDTALSLLLKALESYKSRESELMLDDVTKLIVNILNIFIQDNDKDNINYLQNELFELIEKDLYPRYNLASLKFIKYYKFSNDLDKIDTIIDFLAV